MTSARSFPAFSSIKAMTPPDHLLPLPASAFYLGPGKSFQTGGRNFLGWMYSDGKWVEDDFMGGHNRSYHYAAPINSPVARLNMAIEPPMMDLDADAIIAEARRIAAEESASTQNLETPSLSKHSDSLLPEKEKLKSMREEIRQMTSPEFLERLLPESDPHGIPQNSPGAKLDAGKTQAALLLGFGDALEAVAQVASYGAAKYTPEGWKHVPDGRKRYQDAAGRHLLKMSYEEFDPESGLPHEFHYAWNVLAALQLKLRSSCPTSSLPCPKSPHLPPMPTTPS